MATTWGLTCLLIGLNIVDMCNTHPMEQLLSGNEGPNGQIMGALVAVMVSVCIVFTLLACVCCKRRSGFKVFRNSPVSASVINETSLTGDDPGHINPIANAEFTIFTPLSPPHHNNNVFRSQPPVICYTENEANPEFNKVVNPQIDGLDVSEWFAETEYNFPRNCLKYTRELGPGWFGRVVEGEALGISSPNAWTPVAVRILESSASAHEQAQFLLEAAVYRTEAHPHVLRLLGRSLEATPLLLIQELCPKGDLKRFLMENKELRDSEVMVGVPLRYCTQLAGAVQWLHEHNLPHLDLAARTCQISSDLSLKLGDYGLAVSHYPNDYYQGTPSIPVRWCAPESVNHTNTTLQPKQVTLEANIWSLAVTFWEICEWGRMPYDWLTDDEVISQVMDAPNVRLAQPSFNAYYIPPLYRLMEYCWLPSLNRPQINQIYSMLIHLSKTYTSSPTTSRPTADFSTENFDLRWESFKPNTIIKTDNTRIKSASLTNLHGSFENLTEDTNTIIQMDSWLENVASHTDDMQYVRGLSEAIHELDTALASEQTSSSSSFEPTPLSSLGTARSENILHLDDSSNLDSLIFPKRSESGSETEDETWKRRIERGAYSEKVRQKSKSVADLMVLTHIDMNTVRDIFQEELKKLHEERRESLLFIPVQKSEQIESSSNQSLEVDLHSVTEPSIDDSKLEQLSTTQINLERQENNFDTFLQSTILTTEQENVAVNNQNILNNKVTESTEKNVEHIEIIRIPKNNFPLVQDFINNEIDAENVSQTENIKFESKNKNLEAAPTENLQTLQNIIAESEISDIIKNKEQINEEKKSVSFLKPQQILSNEDKKNISSQVDEIVENAEKTVQFLNESNISNGQKSQQNLDNKESLQIFTQKSVSFLPSSNIKYDDPTTEENIKHQNINTEQAKKSVTFSNLNTYVNSENAPETITQQQNMNREDKDEITSQINEILQEAEDNVNNRLQPKEIKRIHKENEDVKKITHDFLSNEQQNLRLDLKETQKEEIQNIETAQQNFISVEIPTDSREISATENKPQLIQDIQCPMKSAETSHETIVPIGSSNVLLQFGESATENQEISAAEIKSQLMEDIECPTKSAETSQETIVPIGSSNILLQFGESATESQEISAAENKLQLIEDIECPIKSAETSQEIVVPIGSSNVLLQFGESATENQEISAAEIKSQLMEDIECPTRSAETSQETIVPIESSNLLLHFEESSPESQEISAVENKAQLIDDIVSSTKSAETSQNNILPNESSHILLQFEDPTTKNKRIPVVENKIQLTEDIEGLTKSAETSQENIVPIERTNILLQFDETTTEHNKISSLENKSKLTEVVSSTKSAETSQENIKSIESSNILLQFEEPATEKQDIESPTKSSEIAQEIIVPIESSSSLLQFEKPTTENQQISNVETKTLLKSAEISSENIVPIEPTNILLQFADPATENPEIYAVEDKAHLKEDIECPTKSTEVAVTKSAETFIENVLPNEPSNIFLQFEDSATESKENKTQSTTIESPIKEIKIIHKENEDIKKITNDFLSNEQNLPSDLKQTQIQNIETTQKSFVSVEIPNILFQFDEPTTESEIVLLEENKIQLTDGCSTKSGEMMVPAESSNILLQFEDPTTENKETSAAENKTQLTEDIERPIKSAELTPTKSPETSQDNILQIHSSNVLLQFEDPITENKETSAAENKTQLTEDIERPIKSAELTPTKSPETSQDNILQIESSNVLLQFEDPTTENKETSAAENKTQLTEDIERPIKSAELTPTKSPETSQDNILQIESSNVLLQFEDPTTENKQTSAAENKTQVTEDIECPTKSAELTPTKYLETSQDNILPKESSNILLQFEDPTTENKETSAAENKTQLTEDVEFSIKSTELTPTKYLETSQDNILQIESSNVLLQFEDPTTENKETSAAKNKTQVTEDIECPTKSAELTPTKYLETSQDNILQIHSSNVLLQFEDPITENKETSAAENKTQLTEDIERPIKSAELTPTKSPETSQDNILQIHSSNVLLQFEDPITENKETSAAENKTQLTEDIERPIKSAELTPTKSPETSQDNILQIHSSNVLLQFEDPITENKETSAAENKTQLTEDIERPIKSAELTPTKSPETSQDNILQIHSSNVLLQFEDPITENKETSAAENKTQLTEDVEFSIKSAELTPTKYLETSQDNILQIESSNVLLQFEDPTTENKETSAAENKTQLTKDIECPTKSAEISKDNIAPIERTKCLLQSEDPTTENKENKIQLAEEIVSSTKSAETSQDIVLPNESPNILLKFEDPTTENKEISAAENKTQLTKDIECSTKSVEVDPIKSSTTSQENIVLNESTNILLQFEEPTIENKDIPPIKSTENVPSTISTIDYLNTELYQDSTIMPDLIETLNKDQNIDISLKSNESMKQDDLNTEDVKNTEYSTIQNFINNERNNNQEDSTLVETKEKPEPTPVDITADFLDLDDSNVQRINQVFNVFSVTVDHKPPIECFSPVKSYLHPFDQNDLMTGINCLLESEKRYESKNHPFVNGITCEVTNKFIDILEDSTQPKKLAEIALDSLKNNLEQYEMKEDTLTINGHDEKAPKKSELVLESFKTNSLSEDSGFASVQCEEKNTNGIKEEDTSEDILKISVDSLEDILSDENECEETNKPKKLSEIVQDTINKTYEITKETHHLPDLILDNMQNKLENGDILINIDSPLRSLSEKEESTENNFSEKTIIEVTCDNSDIYDEEIFPTSTPFKQKPDTENFFSFVSEGDEPPDSQTHVILGPCEEYGLGLYSGLKTTFEKYSDDDRPEEELLQFSSNFMPFTEAENSVDYSLETWDKFLGKSLQDQDSPSSVFDNFSPRLDVFKNNETKDENLDKTVMVDKNDKTFTIENEVPLSQENKDKSQTETTQSNWEPGGGWFLHPQTETDDLTGQIDISTVEIDNSYVGFALDEECENALRNELAAKLPHAQGMSHEEPQEPEDWDTEERSEIIVKYNVYATPLSPIPEESCCDDVYCDQMQHRDGSDSDSDWSEPGLGHTSQLEDILVVDTETHTALILESPSLREPQHRHTPSQDSCCSNDTLFNLEDLNYGLSPQHHGTLSTTHSQDSDHILEIEITEDTPKHTPTKKLEDNSDSTEMNLTYTKPDINIDESESSNLNAIMDSQETKPDDAKTKLELKLDTNAIGVAPLPSPEDIPWRQLPASLLTYNEVTQNDKFGQEAEQTTENVENLPEEITNDDLSDRDCTIEGDLYSNLTDIRFSGPCDAQLMSTSFSEDAEERDWDSGSDTRSSSSGEFIWKEGEHEESLRALHAASHDVSVMEEISPMDAIDEENSNTSDSDDCEEDEIEETEFVPSAWDAQATPTKSAMRSPEKSNKRKNQQKGVWFKKQKYHCVYEYPREPESPVAPSGDLWRPLSDLSNFTDWELDPDSCIAPSYDDPDGAYDVLDKFITRSGFPLASGSSRHRDLYQLNPFPDFGPCIAASEEDFFISSSARPFQSVGQSSQFFPGQQPPKNKFMWQDYQSSSQQSSRDLSEGITPDSGIDDITPASISDIGVEILPRHHTVPPLKYLAAIAADKSRKIEEKNSDSSLGGLRHTRNRLKLDLPPSPNSFTSTRTFSIDINNDPVVNREIPTFSTFGKTRFSVQHVSTPTEEIPDPLQPGKSKSKNVSFEALPHKPMKLTEKVYIMDNNPEEENHKPVEMVQGEASLLDSADEDSGIESSANATLERHQQQILN